jgi:cyanophycinase
MVDGRQNIRAGREPMGSMIKNRGLLFLIGGAEDHQGDRRVLKHLIGETQARDVAIIPTASGYPLDIGRDYTDAFRDLGVERVNCLDIRYRDEADRDENLKALETADMIFFSGGDQVKLVDTLARAQFMDRVRMRFEAGDLHIDVTRAGATAAGNPMIYHGNHDGLTKGSVAHSDGFGFIDGVAIDTHFTPRGRLSRLSQFLISGDC